MSKEYPDYRDSVRVEFLKVLHKARKLCEVMEEHAVSDDYFNGKHFSCWARLLGSYCNEMEILGKFECHNYSLK